MAAGDTAIAGADAAGLMRQVGQEWDRQIDQWAQRVTTYGHRLEVAADTYQRGDDASLQDFTSLGGLLP